MRTVSIINLTANPLVLYDPTGTSILVTFPKATSCGFKAKMRTETEEWVQVETSDGPPATIHLTKTTFSKDLGFPPPKPNTLYIVSEVIARLYKGEREDLRICDKLIKKDGKVLGCRSLGRI